MQNSCMDFELDCPVGCFWLFAYGGSTNPVTLRLRNISPIRSYPAILPDWKLEFAGVGGLATITRSGGSQCHGVLHLLPAAALPIVDSCEYGHLRREVRAVPYGQHSVPAYTYEFNKQLISADHPSVPPGQRHIDIICQGCQHYGVDDAWIQQIRSTVTQPRRPREEYRTFPVPDGTPTLAMSDIAGMNGVDKPVICVALNGKILKFIGTDQYCVYHAFAKIGGTDISHFCALMLYEPLYVPAFSPQDMTPDHSAWAEDIVVGLGAENWTVVGLLPIVV